MPVDLVNRAINAIEGPELRMTLTGRPNIVCCQFSLWLQGQFLSIISEDEIIPMNHFIIRLGPQFYFDLAGLQAHDGTDFSGGIVHQPDPQRLLPPILE
jgi:hypothetical protein